MLGVTAVIDKNKVVGIITDGDLRRMLVKADSFHGLTAKDIMSKNMKEVSTSDMGDAIIAKLK